MSCGFALKHITQAEWVVLASASFGEYSPEKGEDSRLSEIGDGSTTGGHLAYNYASDANSFKGTLTLSADDLYLIFDQLYEFGAGFWNLDIKDFSHSGADKNSPWILQFGTAQQIDQFFWTLDIEGYL